MWREDISVRYRGACRHAACDSGRGIQFSEIQPRKTTRCENILLIAAGKREFLGVLIRLIALGTRNAFGEETKLEGCSAKFGTI